MKWFKHYTDADRDIKIQNLKENFGWDYLGRYWTLLEMIAFEMEKENSFEPKLLTTKKKLSSLLGLKQNKLSSFLVHLQDQMNFKVESNENILIIEMPKMLKLKDNHTTNLQVTDKQKVSNLHLDKDKDKDKEEDTYTQADEPIILDAKEADNKKDFVSCVVDEYNNICLGLPRVKVIPEKRKKSVLRVKKEIETLQDLQNWKSLFETVVKSDFLMGNVTKFKASFDWIINPNNCAKILEGNYGHRPDERERLQSEIDFLIAKDFSFEGIKPKVE